MSRIYIVNLFGKDHSTDPATDVTLRLSSSEFHNALNPYFSRITELILNYDMESNLWNTNESQALIKFINSDGQFDDYHYYTMLSGEIRKGDSENSYDNLSFPVIWKGPIRRYRTDKNVVNITLADRLGYLNVDIFDTFIEQSVFNGIGNIPTTLLHYLIYHGTNFQTGINNSHINISKLFQIVSDYSFQVKVLPSSGKQKYLKLLDAVLEGLPYSMCTDRTGKISLAKFTSDLNTFEHEFNNVQNLVIETIHPAAETQFRFVNVNNALQDGSLYFSNAIKERYPSIWRSLRGAIIRSNETTNSERRTTADTIANNLLQLFGLRFDRVKFTTTKNIDDIELGDKIRIQSNRYDFDSGRNGFVTRIRERLNGIHDLEAWVINDATEVVTTSLDSQDYTLPALTSLMDNASSNRPNDVEYTMRYSDLALTVPSFLSNGGSITIDQIDFLPYAPAYAGPSQARFSIDILFEEATAQFDSAVISNGYIEFDFSNLKTIGVNGENAVYRNKLYMTPERNDIQSTGDNIEWENSGTGYRLVQPDGFIFGTKKGMEQLPFLIAGARDLYNALLANSTAGITMKVSTAVPPTIATPSAPTISFVSSVFTIFYNNNRTYCYIKFNSIDIEKTTNTEVQYKVDNGEWTDASIVDVEYISTNNQDRSKDTYLLPILSTAYSGSGHSSIVGNFFGIVKVLKSDGYIASHGGQTVRIRVRCIGPGGTSGWSNVISDTR